MIHYLKKIIWNTKRNKKKGDLRIFKVSKDILKVRRKQPPNDQSWKYGEESNIELRRIRSWGELGSPYSEETRYKQEGEEVEEMKRKGLRC